MKFSEVPVGVCFTMSKGLLWRKLSETEAVDVWSGRLITVKPNIRCDLLKGDPENKCK